MNIGLSIFLIFLLIFINAIFSGSESALVAVNDLMIDDLAAKGDRKAKIIKKYIDSSTRFFSTTQIMMTFLAFINGILAADALTEPILSLIGNDLTWGGWSMVIQLVITIFLTFFQVVLGELVPKRLAIKYPKGYLNITIDFVNISSIIVRPFVWLFAKTANGICRLMKIKPDDNERLMTEEEIRMLVKAGGNKGVIEQVESEMITNVLDFADLTATAVMTHRTEMSALNINSTKEEVVKFALAEQYSRIPVYADNIDHIVGVLHTKDLFKYIANARLKFDLKTLIRKPLFVADTQLISEVFTQMKQKKVHLALVLDEYGGTAGMVTIEDLLEEIVGSILDEHDIEEDEDTILKLDDNSYIIDGLMSINDVDDALDLDLPVTEYTTLAGFILGELGYLPKNHENVSITYMGWTFEVISFAGNIIDKVKVTKNIQESDEHA